MAKKKVHKNRKKGWFGSDIDNHHIFYTRVSWNQALPNKLRTHWYCIVDIPKGTIHHRIHEKVRYIPVPRNSTITDVLEELGKLQSYGAIHPDDSIEKRLKVLIGLFDCVDQPTADALKKQLEVVTGDDKPP